nr:uncharacterized protein LOC124817091 [Hydra vulgaris]
MQMIVLDSKGAIGKITGIINQFKKVVYANSVKECEDAFSNIIDLYGEKYPKLKLYLLNVFEIKERWCICFRKNITIRGNNTNNYVEAQFLVLKDNILNRTKEVNVNGLVEKLTQDFNEHYKAKLLSIANGRFDGIYSNRFLGRDKGKKVVGFALPSPEVLQNVEKQISKVGLELYTVPSFNLSGVHYNVDMSIGICDCSVGCDGSPCKHQYIVWKKHLYSTNFLPYLSCKERQLCSYNAIGAILPDSLYEGLHDYVRDKHDEFIYKDNFSAPSSCEDISNYEETDFKIDRSESVNNQGISASTVQTSNTENIQQELAEAFKIMSILVDKHYNNADFLKGVSKFCIRLKMNENRISNLTSSLHCFGIDSYQSKRITNTTLRKKRNGVKIKVQPEAVKRQKLKMGARRLFKKEWQSAITLLMYLTSVLKEHILFPSA